jgi:hypothetical protein
MRTSHRRSRSNRHRSRKKPIGEVRHQHDDTTRTHSPRLEAISTNDLDLPPTALRQMHRRPADRRRCLRHDNSIVPHAGNRSLHRDCPHERHHSRSQRDDRWEEPPKVGNESTKATGCSPFAAGEPEMALFSRAPFAPTEACHSKQDRCRNQRRQSIHAPVAPGSKGATIESRLEREDETGQTSEVGAPVVS